MLHRHFGSRLAAAALTLAAATFVAGPARAEQPDVPQKSPHARVEQQVGVTTFAIEYGSPAVRGRTIWGELVPWGQVWRTGANAATRLSASREFRFGDETVPAGTYALFTIPGQKSWTVILNSKADTWGAFEYDASKDVARIEVKPTALAEKRERMTFLFSDATDDSVHLDLEWEKVRVRIPLRVDTRAHVMANIAAATEEAWRPHVVSARWLLENGGDLEQALRYVDTSIAVKPTWLNHWVKAQILGKTGKKKLAVENAKAAQKLGAGDRIYPFYEKAIEAAIDEWD